MKPLFTTLLLALAITSQAQTTPATDSVYLSGTIKNAAKYPNSINAVKLMVSEPVSYKVATYQAQVKTDGTYQVAFTKRGPLDLHLIYNNSLINVLVQPGNHLQINFDADNSNVIQFEGDNAQPNRELAAYRALQDQQNQAVYGTGQSAYATAILNKQKSEKPEAYRDFLRAAYRQDSELLNRFIKEQHPGTDFVQWAWANLQCEYYNNVMGYAWQHTRTNGSNADDFKLPAGYFNFLQAKIFNDTKLAQSSAYPKLMHEYSLYLSRQTPNRPDMLAKEMDLFLSLPKGIAKDVMLCDMLHEKINTKQVNELEPYKIRLEQSINNAELKNLFNQEYQAALQQQASL